MKKKKKYLPLYYKWMTEGRLPTMGLCSALKSDPMLDLFQPEYEDRKYLRYNLLPIVWWGRESYNYPLRMFTPLRQNIVLFLAAMNDEL